MLVWRSTGLLLKVVPILTRRQEEWLLWQLLQDWAVLILLKQWAVDLCCQRQEGCRRWMWRLWKPRWNRCEWKTWIYHTETDIRWCNRNHGEYKLHLECSTEKMGGTVHCHVRWITNRRRIWDAMYAEDDMFTHTHVHVGVRNSQIWG